MDKVVQIYFSGGGVKGVWQPVNEYLINRGASRLVSFEYKRLALDYCELAKSLNKRLPFMLDSGAFSAWSRGTEIDREQLGNFFEHILNKYDMGFCLINLDKIPGSKGVTPTVEQLKEAMVLSQDNYVYLEKRFPGMVLPVYHQGEPETFFRNMRIGTDYICLSPRNDLHEKFRVEWSQSINLMGAKAHGLATTGVDMMETVNWYSVDSAAWVFVAGMGNIFWRTVTGKIRPLSISLKSPSQKNMGRHVNTVSKIEKDQIMHEIESAGMSFERMLVSDIERYKWNAKIWLDYKPKDRLIKAGSLL